MAKHLLMTNLAEVEVKLLAESSFEIKRLNTYCLMSKPLADATAGLWSFNVIFAISIYWLQSPARSDFICKIITYKVQKPRKVCRPELSVLS